VRQARIYPDLRSGALLSGPSCGSPRNGGALQHSLLNVVRRGPSLPARLAAGMTPPQGQTTRMRGSRGSKGPRWREPPARNCNPQHVLKSSPRSTHSYRRATRSNRAGERCAILAVHGRARELSTDQMNSPLITDTVHHHCSLPLLIAPGSYKRFTLGVLRGLRELPSRTVPAAALRARRPKASLDLAARANNGRSSPYLAHRPAFSDRLDNPIDADALVIGSVVPEFPPHPSQTCSV